MTGCCYAECRLCCVPFKPSMLGVNVLNVIMLSVIYAVCVCVSFKPFMLGLNVQNVIMLSVVMPSVVAPFSLSVELLLDSNPQPQDQLQSALPLYPTYCFDLL